jgi:hypothetical protein
MCILKLKVNFKLIIKYKKQVLNNLQLIQLLKIYKKIIKMKKLILIIIKLKINKITYNSWINT